MKTTINYPCKRSEAENIITCLKPEIRKDERSDTKVKVIASGIAITITAKDLPALRAGFNSITKLLAVYHEMKNE